ncbi:hypothetical protein PoB_003577300 [Plakobranchus ocellatus]|uniref:Uncharacterized protein n=1 Tax=Plakobranchus ocellatus TaxID=259542 RepID=A0AAV4ART1_9GAST|nr:hypothetical protein PoB_003577300 [Plakobranchus ocellatus]
MGAGSGGGKTVARKEEAIGRWQTGRKEKGGEEEVESECIWGRGWEGGKKVQGREKKKAEKLKGDKWEGRGEDVYFEDKNTSLESRQK